MAYDAVNSFNAWSSSSNLILCDTDDIHSNLYFMLKAYIMGWLR